MNQASRSPSHSSRDQGSLGRPRMKILFDDDPKPQTAISESNWAMLVPSGLHEKSGWRTLS